MTVRALIRFAGTRAEVLAAFAAVGITVAAKHLATTGSDVETVWLTGAQSVEGRGDVRLDFKWISDLTRLIEPEKTVGKVTTPAVYESRGAHADVLIRGGGVVEKYVTVLSGIAETQGVVPLTIKAKWPSAEQVYKQLSGGARLVYITPLESPAEGEQLAATNTPLAAPVHGFA